MDELGRARAILTAMLAQDFPGAREYREQLTVATLVCGPAGCNIDVDRERSSPAPYDVDHPGARLPVEATGHGKLWIILHGFEGFLDDLELVSGKEFPPLETIRVHTS